MTNRKRDDLVQMQILHRYVNHQVITIQKEATKNVRYSLPGRQVPIFSYFSQHTPIFLAISSYFSYFLAILHVICILYICFQGLLFNISVGHTNYS